MDQLPEKLSVPPPPPPPQESRIGKYTSITQDKKGELYGYKSINRGGGVTEKIHLNKFTGKAERIGDRDVVRDPSSKQATGLRDKDGVVTPIKRYGGVSYIGNEELGGDTSWLD